MAVNKPALETVWGLSSTLKEAPEEAKQDTGWGQELPFVEHMNWLLNKFDHFAHHSNVFGVPQWDDETEYTIGSIVLASDALLYRSIVAGNIDENPTTSPSSWGSIGTKSSIDRQEEEFLTSGIWTRPLTMAGDHIRVIAVGGGGGGAAATAGSGGGGGQVIIRMFDITGLAAGTGTLTITIGAGGGVAVDGGDTYVTGSGVAVQARGGMYGDKSAAGGGASGGGAQSAHWMNSTGHHVAKTASHGPTSEYGSSGGAGGTGATAPALEIAHGANGGNSFGGGGRGWRFSDQAYSGGGGASWGSGGGGPLITDKDAAANTGGGGRGYGGVGGSGYCKIIWHE
ncbi:MAG: hypothetical protein DRJ03_07495 [Chloroflexi bacterium]|nr:MAG: hypothetical protein DRJ03_07495 [Chloroflexota bacterium]